MRVLLTGASGTLGQVLARRLRAQGDEVIAWPRAQVPPEDAAAGQRWLSQQRPDAIAHLATGGVAWADGLAGWAAEHAVPLVFTSTAMVFDHEPDGPHGVADARTARDDYGRSKIACEDAVLGRHPAATVLRLGWQIGDPDDPAAGNTMQAALDSWMARDGEIAASHRWTPACSFVDDSLGVLMALLRAPQAGVLHLDSNAAEGHRFDTIVRALAARLPRPHWRVRSVDGYQHDQRLRGGEALVPPLSARLPMLLRPPEPAG
jgi:dTDP-4-dehydrorhamnose reductase